jgi:hypothetical protein
LMLLSALHLKAFAESRQGLGANPGYPRKMDRNVADA